VTKTSNLEIELKNGAMSLHQNTKIKMVHTEKQSFDPYTVVPSINV